jgi:hypothetical protein
MGTVVVLFSNFLKNGVLWGDWEWFCKRFLLLEG